MADYTARAGKRNDFAVAGVVHQVLSIPGAAKQMHPAPMRIEAAANLGAGNGQRHPGTVIAGNANDRACFHEFLAIQKWCGQVELFE